MSHSKISTENVYHKIIQKVCEKMREEFQSEGIEEGTLEEIKQVWKNKLYEDGILEPNSSYKINNNQDKFFNQKKNFDNNNKDIYSDQLSNTQNIINNNNNFNVNLQYNNNKSLNTPLLKSQYFDDNKEIIKKFDNNSNQITNNNNNNINTNENTNQEIKTEEELNDPYLKYFNGGDHQNEEKDENNEQKENDEVLSELEDEADDEEDKDSKDFLLCLYEKVHRVKTKWKVTLNEVVLHAKGKEYVYKKLNGDLERDW